MKSIILLLAVSVAVFTSCTTSYKSGQTPDDVYYSPARPEADEYVQTEKQDDRRYRNVEEYYDDRYLRMKVRNRNQWSDLDDWYYYGGRYSNNIFPHRGIYNDPWTPYTFWNTYYNPYCHSCCIIVNPKTSMAYSKPRTFNLNTYNNNALTNKTYINAKSGRSNNNYNNNNTYSAPRNSNSNNSNAGNVLREIFGGNKSNSSGTTPSSSSNNSSNSSSGSSSGKSGGSAPVRKF